MITKNISFHILMQYPPFKESVESGDKKKFEAILYESGVDLEAGYDVVSCEHRPYPTSPFTFNGPLVKAVERQDTEWLNNPICSWEAKVESTRDPYLRAELKNMSREGGADKTWNDEGAAKAVIRKEKRGY